MSEVARRLTVVDANGMVGRGAAQNSVGSCCPGGGVRSRRPRRGAQNPPHFRDKGLPALRILVTHWFGNTVS